MRRALPWWIAGAAVVLNVAAYAFSLYEVRGFDEVVHAGTFFAATFVVQRLLAADLPRRGAARFLLLVACSMALGVVWEWMEWAYDFFTETNSILGKQDTLVDLVADTLGGALAAGLLLRLAR